MGQALPPVSAVTREDSNHSLLPKQAGGLGPWCPKTVCPSNSPSGSFEKLYILILREKSERTIHIKAQYSNFHLKSSSTLVSIPITALCSCAIEKHPQPTMRHNNHFIYPAHNFAAVCKNLCRAD